MISHHSAEDVVGLYVRKGEAWNDLRRATLFVERPWIDRFLALLRRGGTVLDLGCGSGEPIADYFVERGFKVCGVDTSEPMLARARARQPTQEWIEADMRTLALGRRFDGAILWDSFFHLTQEAQRAMFLRLATHTNAQAPLLFTSGPQNGEAIGEMFGEALYHASLSPDEYRTLFAEHGFEEIAHIADDEKAGGRTVWLARRLYPNP